MLWNVSEPQEVDIGKPGSVHPQIDFHFFSGMIQRVQEVVQRRISTWYSDLYYA